VSQRGFAAKKIKGQKAKRIFAGRKQINLWWFFLAVEQASGRQRRRPCRR
jgi:hypothetical protein